MLPAPGLPGTTAKRPASAAPRQPCAAWRPDAPEASTAASAQTPSVAFIENTAGQVLPPKHRPVQSKIGGKTDEKSGQPPPSGGGTHFCGVYRTDGGIAVERRGRRRRPTRLRRATDGDPHGRSGRQPAPRRLSPTPADHADP